MKTYDIYFKLDTYAVMSVCANTKKQAKEKAEQDLIVMSKDEILERLWSAISVDPQFKIIHIENIGD